MGQKDTGVPMEQIGNDEKATRSRRKRKKKIFLSPDGILKTEIFEKGKGFLRPNSFGWKTRVAGGKKGQKHVWLRHKLAKGKSERGRSFKAPSHRPETAEENIESRDITLPSRGVERLKRPKRRHTSKNQDKGGKHQRVRKEKATGRKNERGKTKKNAIVL